MTPLFRTVSVLLTAAALALPVSAKDDALSLVPADAVTVGMAQLAQMRTSPLSSLLFQHVDKMTSEGEAETFLLEAGVRPSQDVDAVVVATSPRANGAPGPDILVIAEGRFQPERLAAAFVSRGAVRKGAYLVFPESARSDDDRGAVAFLSPSLAIAGTERSVVKAIAARQNGGTGFTTRGTLARHIGRIDRAATAWAIIDVPRAARIAKADPIDTGNGQAGAALQAALKSVSVVALWARDTGDTLQLGATGLSDDAETLELLEDAFRGALAAMRIAVKDKAPEMVSVLRRFDVERTSESLTVGGSIPGVMLRELMVKRLAAASDH